MKTNRLAGELSEFYQLKKVIENNDSHNQESVFDHTLSVLGELDKIIEKSSAKIINYLDQIVDNHTKKELLFLAALFHDIAKKETLKSSNNCTSCRNHEESGSIKAAPILSRFNLSAKEKALICEIIKNHGTIHLILMPANERLSAEFEKLKIDCSNIFLELMLLGLADTARSYLQTTKPKEFKFKINFYDNVLSDY